MEHIAATQSWPRPPQEGGSPQKTLSSQRRMGCNWGSVKWGLIPLILRQAQDRLLSLPQGAGGWGGGTWIPAQGRNDMRKGREDLGTKSPLPPFVKGGFKGFICMSTAFSTFGAQPCAPTGFIMLPEVFVKEIRICYTNLLWYE